MTETKIFEHPEFGRIRTVEVNGEPWLVGKDVALALGYKDTVNAMKAHVDVEDKRGCQITTPSGVQTMTIINESGLYSLVLGSKLPGAKKFKRWVTSEVLPSIRKTGGYRVQCCRHAAQSIPPMIRDQIDYIAALRRGLRSFLDLKSRADIQMDRCKAELARAKAAFGEIRDIERGLDGDIARETAALEGAIDALETMTNGRMAADVLDMLARDIDPLEMLDCGED